MSSYLLSLVMFLACASGSNTHANATSQQKIKEKQNEIKLHINKKIIKPLKIF